MPLNTSFPSRRRMPPGSWVSWTMMIISASGAQFPFNQYHHLYCFLILTRLFRHHVFVKTGKKEVQLAEVGPRFEMKREPDATRSLQCYWCFSLAYEIRLGTIEQEEADKEWVLSHYTRTARKRRVLWWVSLMEVIFLRCLPLRNMLGISEYRFIVARLNKSTFY